MSHTEYRRFEDPQSMPDMHDLEMPLNEEVYYGDGYSFASPAASRANFDGPDSARWSAVASSDALNKKDTEMFAPFEIQNIVLRIIASLFGLPFIGLFWIRFAVKAYTENKQVIKNWKGGPGDHPPPAVGNNSADWMVIFWIGLLHQFSMIGLINVFKSPEYLFCVYPTDYYGAVVFYPLSVAYMMAISFMYKVHKDAAINFEKQKAKRSNARTTKSQVKTQDVVEQLRKQHHAPSWLIIPGCSGLGALMVFIIRLCIDCPLYKNSQGELEMPISRFSILVGHGECPDESFNQFSHGHLANITRGEDPDFEVMNGFWWLIATAACSSALYAFLLFSQLVKQVESFVYKRFGNSRKGRDLKTQFMKDVEQFSKDAGVWSQIWQELVEAINHRPVVRAFVSTNAVATFLGFVIASLYLVFQNVLDYHEVGELTTASIALAGFNTFMLLAFLVFTVRLQRSVEAQVRSISKQQNDLQRQIDAQKGTADRDHLLRMQSNLRVLASLDVYLTYYDNSPKLVGSLNLESFRWIATLGGMVAMNVFFFALYVSRCYQPKQPRLLANA